MLETLLKSKLKEIKSDVCYLSIRLNNIIREEKIDEGAKKELDIVATELYYLSTKSDLKTKDSSKKTYEDEHDRIRAETENLKIDLKEIKSACAGASSDIDTIIQKYQIDDREAELLEDVSAEFGSIKNEAMGLERTIFNDEKITCSKESKVTTIDDFFELKPNA